jgi:hypothetical protein
MKLLRSFEEFIFEAVTWLIFYPVTLWRIVTRPLTTMAYSDAEQLDADDKRYDDALSPPLLLLVTVVAVNAIAGALYPEQPHATSAATRALLASPQNLAIFRALIFSLVPLVAAATVLKRTEVALSRETLRAPFYAQCYLATPCSIVIGLGHAIFQRPDMSNAIGTALLVVGGLWFFVTQIRWFRARLSVSWGNAALTTVWAFVRAIAFLIMIFIPLTYI